MKSKDIRKKTKDECLLMLAEKAKRIHDVRFTAATAKPKNTKERHNLRKDIARIKTILKESKEDDK
jgi:large subunit ribosomal protein L29